MSFTTGATSSTGNSSSSSSLASTNVPQGTLGDVPPVTFPGIASGIDYNAIIEKYTAATQEAEVPYQDQLNKLNAQNAEILKIQNLLNVVQDSLTALSNPSTFEAFTATPSNTADASATQVSGQVAVPGTYNIVSQTAATSTQVVNNIAANATLTAADESSTGPALVDLGTAITPSNGTQSDGDPALTGTLTINGVQISYNVDSDNLYDLQQAIQNANCGAALTFNANGTATLTATTAAGLALGSASDTGNILQVLGFQDAQYVGSGDGESVTSSSPIIAINQYATLDGTGNAGFATAVTSGFFTINGVQITVNAGTDSVNDVIQAINQSTAGVTASFNTATNQIVLTNSASGPQNIVLGASNDTSNFLVAAGLTGTYGSFTADPDIPGTTTTGTQASITYQNADGADVTAYSSSGSFTNVIPGINLTVLASTTTPYTVTVASDPSAAEKAINAFVTAYNNAMTTLNSATQAPTVTSGFSTTTGQETNTSSGGGVLYNSFEVTLLRDQLVQTVSQFIPTGSASYNSLQSIGLDLDTASVSANTNDSTTSTSADSDSDTTTYSATDGKLAALDTTTFEAALAADPTAVQALFTSQSGLADVMGSQLTTATGLPTYLKSGIAGDIPASGILTNVEDMNQLQIDSLEEQINQINTEAKMQADSLRDQFTASETQIAELQVLQQQIAAIGH